MAANRASKKVTLNKEMQDIERVMQNASLLERSMMGRRLGTQYNGERNLYDAFGYDVNPDFARYKSFYDRMGIATRVVEMFPDDTWGNPPILVDGKSRSDKEEDQTEFIKIWNETVKRLKLWQKLREADVLCGIGRWSVLFLGAPGDYAQEAGKDGLAFLSCYDEPNSQPSTWVKDKMSGLYGMPETYSIRFNAAGEGGAEVESGLGPVHYSRVIHVSENRLGTRYTGRPRLQTALNTLFDLEKIVGGAAEAVWLTLFKGIAIMAREGTNLPTSDSMEGRKLKEQLNLLANRIQRYIALENVELKDLGVDEIRIRETFDIEIDTLCAIEKIPKRILMGSERGELASSQDVIQWAGVISRRQKFFAEPEILDPFVSWCIAHNILPMPTSGKWTWEWQSLYKPSPVEQSSIAVNLSQAAHNLTQGLGDTVVKANEIRTLVDLPELTDEELNQIEVDREEEKEMERERLSSGITPGIPVELPTKQKQITEKK